MSFPSVTEYEAVISGVSAYVCCTVFSDHVFLVISQVPTFGTLVRCLLACEKDGELIVSLTPTPSP